MAPNLNNNIVRQPLGVVRRQKIFIDNVQESQMLTVGSSLARASYFFFLDLC